MDILTAIDDDNLFRSFLTDSKGSIKSWNRWKVALRTLYGLPVPKHYRWLVQQCTGRDPAKLPRKGFSTALFLTGRRSGKSRTAAIIGVYEGVLAGRQAKLSKGEHGVVPVVSPTKSQSRVVRDYMRAICQTPLIAQEVATETRDGIELKDGTRIECLAGDWRTVRNFTCLCCVLDEAAFMGYSEESKVKSDTELVRALKPSLATSGGKMIIISSPYAMKGYCYQQYQKCFGNDRARTLVWNCGSRVMNPTLPQSIVDEAMIEDRAAAEAEYLGRFRSDVQSFLPRDVVQAAVVPGRTSIRPDKRRRYFAFCDLSGGRADDAALAIGHQQGHRTIIDLVRRWRAPFSPDEIVGDMVKQLASYQCKRVTGDRYSANFAKDAFTARGVRYDWSEKVKSDCYLELLPRICSGQVELPDDEVLISQLSNLNRFTRSGGRDRIDHMPGQHDDVSNAVAGCVTVASKRRVELRPMFGAGSEPPGTTQFEREMADLERRQIEHREEMEEMYRNGGNDKYELFEQAGGFRQCVTRAAARKQQRPATSRHAPPPGGFRGMPAPGPSRSSDPSVGRSPGDVFGGGGSTGRSPRDLFGL